MKYGDQEEYAEGEAVVVRGDGEGIVIGRTRDWYTVRLASGDVSVGVKAGEMKPFYYEESE